MADPNDVARSVAQGMGVMPVVNKSGEAGQQGMDWVMQLLQRLGLMQQPPSPGIQYPPTGPLPQIDPNNPGQIIQPQDLRNRMVR